MPLYLQMAKNIVFEAEVADWDKNRYDRELWLSKNGAKPFQITNNAKNSSNRPDWSPNGEWIAFLSNRSGKNQIQLIRTDGGESFQLTDTEKNISGFEWSPDGKKIAFLQSEDKSKEEKKRKDKYGGFEIEDKEYGLDQLWVIDFKPESLNKLPLPEQAKDSTYLESLKPKLLIEDAGFSINDYRWSPDGKQIAIEHQPNPLRNSFFKADISIYDIASKTHKILVNNLSYDGLIDWSPDGNSILYATHLNDSTSNYYLNGKLFRIDLDGSNNKQLAKDI